MVYVVSGLLGTGKSAHCCRLAKDHMISGGVVATNMDIHLDKVQELYGRRLRPWQLVRVDAESDPRKIPAGDLRGRGRRRVMVILDEALNWFASSPGAKDDRKLTWGEWLRQSDKLGQDVYFIAQHFERAAKWIRELAQVALRIVNLGNLHLLRMPVGKWMRLRYVYAVAKYEIGAAQLLSLNLYYIDTKIRACYETAELYGFVKPADGYLGTVAPEFKVPMWPVAFDVALFLWAWWLYA